MKFVKKIFTFVLLAIGVFTVLGINSIKLNAADGEVNSVVLHYFRFDNKQSTGWDCWLWGKESDSGSAYTFTDESDGWASITLKADSKAAHEKDLLQNTEIGFIIRTKGSWDRDREPGGNRFLKYRTATPDATGAVHYYIMQGDSEIYTSKEGLNTSGSFFTAYFSSEKVVNFTSSACKSSSTITDAKLIANGSEEIAISNFTKNADGSGAFTSSQNVDLGKTYTLTAKVDGSEASINITFDGIYETDYFTQQYTYTGDDLGATINKNKTTFKVWAPVATKVQVCIYESGHTTTVRAIDGSDAPYITKDLTRGKKGVWEITLDDNFEGKYYTYKVTNGSKTSEAVDPYAKATGVNGLRGMIIDFSQHNPTNWASTKRPSFSGKAVDAIIYELHVRDLSTSFSWGGSEEYIGTYMAFTETGTKYSKGGVTVTTGLDHLKELGITHIQVLPIEDYPIVDETRLHDPSYTSLTTDGVFNWGYMTNNFNSVEGGYSTDPYNGATSVYEYKAMIQALHQAGIRINMDVVYNHTAYSSEQNLNLIVPGYYHRLTETGAYSNGSGCGNEVASERSMVRKFIVDSVTFWAEEYNVDGFRFDLMALMDTKTLNEITDSLHDVDPTIICYGEPWTGGTSTLPSSAEDGNPEQANKLNMKDMPKVGSFNDIIRNGIRGNNDSGDHGWQTGKTNQNIGSMIFGITGGDANYKNAYAGDGEYTFTYTSPNQSINYVDCHDNYTIYDKIASQGYTGEKAVPLQIQANAIVLLSQGMPFINSGAEFMRTKNGNHNSYNSTDSINQLNYASKIKYPSVFENYKQLIQIRKDHPALRMDSYSQIEKNLKIISTDDGVFAYRIKSSNDRWSDFIVIHNSNEASSIDLGRTDNFTAQYTNVTNSEVTVGESYKSLITLQPNETMILTASINTSIPLGGNQTNNGWVLPVVISACAVVVIAAAGALFIVMKKKKVA